jgi:hypothetical protein
LNPKTAGLLLYGLQIAARNQPKSILHRFNTVAFIAHTEDGIPFDTMPYDPDRDNDLFEEDEEELDEDGFAIDKPVKEVVEKKQETTRELAARLRLNLKQLATSQDD